MPIIDGRVVRARYTSLKLDEISSVDRPAQVHATAAIMKRDDREGEDMTVSFEKRVAEIEKRDSVPTYQAMSKARQEFPDAFAAYQESAYQPAEPPAPSAAQLQAQKAMGDFMVEARETAKREGVALHVAMSRVRVERPDLFAALN